MKKLVFASLISLTTCIAYSQTYQAAKSQIVVVGTSNVHEWQMTATASKAGADLLIKDGRLTGLTAIKFSLAVKDLKGDATLMNKRAYRALKSYPYDRIYFNGKSADEFVYENGKYITSVTGNLNIAGITHIISFPLTFELHSDGSVTCAGSATVKMSEFGVRLPEVLVQNMGIADEVKVSFLLSLATKDI